MEYLDRAVAAVGDEEPPIAVDREALGLAHALVAEGLEHPAVEIEARKAGTAPVDRVERIGPTAMASSEVTAERGSPCRGSSSTTCRAAGTRPAAG